MTKTLISTLTKGVLKQYKLFLGLQRSVRPPDSNMETFINVFDTDVFLKTILKQD